MTSPALPTDLAAKIAPDLGPAEPHPELGALVAQRLCHDLVNPLGAIGNGLELLAMSQPPSPEMALIRDSLDQALGRIKLYRLAFGAAQAGSRMAGTDLAGALQGVGGSRPIDLALDLPAEMSRPDARLLALLALCAETALAWGGRLAIGLTGNGLHVSAQATRLRQDPHLWAALSEGRAPTQATPSQVQFAAAPTAARAAGRRLGVAVQAERIDLSA